MALLAKARSNFLSKFMFIFKTKYFKFDQVIFIFIFSSRQTFM